MSTWPSRIGGSSLWAYTAAIATVALCTLINRMLVGKTHDEVLVMVYLLGLLPVACLGRPGAAGLTALLSVLAFDFFFTQPRFTFVANDPAYYFTFGVMGLAGLLISSLTAQLTAALASNRQRAARAEALGKELAEANAELETLDRLKTDLLSNVSHELRTPLTTITGNVELLQDQVGGSLSADQRAMVTQIDQGAQRLAQMVSYLLDFAQLESGSFTFAFENADLRRVVSDVLEVFRPRIDAARLTLEAQLPKDAVWMEMDPQRVAQVLSNLLDNAVKFTPVGGALVVELHPEPENAIVQVSDTGIGIAADQLTRVFQKFYQVDATSTREFGGTGLGLAFSKALVEAQGGRIGLMSEPGRGTTVWFELPRRQAVRLRADPGAGSASAIPTRHPHAQAPET